MVGGNERAQGPGSMSWRANSSSNQLAPRAVAPPSQYRPGPATRHSRAVSTLETIPQGTVAGASSNSYVPPHARPGAKATPSKMDQTSQQFGSTKLGGEQWNTSIAPAPYRAAGSMLTCHFAAPGQIANSMATLAVPSHEQTKWRPNPISIKSPWKRSTFNKGDVISAPYHVANMNPDRAPEDPNLRLSEVGPVLSKRRMLVVLFKFKETMFTVPLYSVTGRGIVSRRQDIIDQYIQLIHVDEKDKSKFEGNGVYQAIEYLHARGTRPLHEWSTIHITGGKTISWEEDIELVGRLTKDSYLRLMKVWGDFNKEANKEDCPWPV